MTTNALKLTSPHELLAVAPYLLGFHPTCSLVVLCLFNNKLGLTQRLDLPRAENAHNVAEALLPSLVKEKPEAVIVIVIGYGTRRERACLHALEALTVALHSHTIQIHDRLVVRDSRWRSLDCDSRN